METMDDSKGKQSLFQKSMKTVGLTQFHSLRTLFIIIAQTIRRVSPQFTIGSGRLETQPKWHKKKKYQELGTIYNFCHWKEAGQDEVYKSGVKLTSDKKGEAVFKPSSIFSKFIFNPASDLF